TVADLKKGVTYGFVADTKGNGTDQPTVTKGSNSAAIGANSSDGGRSNVVSVGAPGAERQVTNVAAGTQATDAVNVQQLNQSVAQGVSQAVGQANNYTDQRFGQLNNRLDAVGAAAMAASSLIPNARAGSDFQMSVAAGTYGGAGALALGANYWVSNRLLLNAHVSETVGSAGARTGASVGMTYGF
ncbi:YadA-like family protein, partial [Paraburkholderia humisilvae]